MKLAASLKLGYFAQEALDLLDPDLTIEEQLQKDVEYVAQTGHQAPGVHA